MRKNKIKKINKLLSFIKSKNDASLKRRSERAWTQIQPQANLPVHRDMQVGLGT